jgi:hypothetical protein
LESFSLSASSSVVVAQSLLVRHRCQSSPRLAVVAVEQFLFPNRLFHQQSSPLPAASPSVAVAQFLSARRKFQFSHQAP